MAVEPLFNADKETLLKRTRIQSADNAQTLSLIDQTITEVRLGFYHSIGKDRSATIAGYSLVDNPVSDEEILRAGGATTEALWLTWLLVQRLPMLFMDNSASTGDAFNDEQLTRDSSGLKDFLKNLKTQIDQGLADLMEPSEENAGAVKSSTIQPDTLDLIWTRHLGLYPSGTNSALRTVT